MNTGRVVRRILVALVIGLALLAGLGYALVEWRWTRHFEAPYPAIRASSDSATIERGRYLVFGPAACAYCHVSREQWGVLDAGTQLPLSGHHLFRLPFGEVYSANLTPDPATGIGRQPGGAIGHPRRLPREPRLVLRGVSHGSRSGRQVGRRFSDGQRMDVAADPTKVYVSPNLTPDPDTSPIGTWSEDAFIARFRVGPTIAGRPMPWGAFTRMTDDDLRSVYRYLRSLPPTRKAVGPPVQPKREG